MNKSLQRLFFVLSCLVLFSVTAAAQSRPTVPAAEVNGTFKMSFTGKFKEFSNEIKILAVGGGKLRVAFDLVYPYSMQNGEPMVNMGTLDETASIEGDTALIAPEDSKCRIKIKFVTSGTIKVVQEGSDASCGFGHNVSAEGIYKKVSGKKPAFEER